MANDGTFHRWDGEYLTERDAPNLPEARRRVALALGKEPVENARYLLPAISLPSFAVNGETAIIESRTEDEQFSYRMRFARSVEIRLLPTGRRFPGREVWRAVYALGLEWGDMDLFHWRIRDGAKGVGKLNLFTVSAFGQPGYFLPERAAEGEAVAGLVFSFELPTNPAPVATFDRMAVALDYFRQRVGGRPTASDGGELDHDRLFDERDALGDLVAEMTSLGIPPGSPAAARFF